jgi:CHASE2 domain-containing sensor protein
MALARLRLFVSYRRSDSEGSAGRLADALARQFGADHVFLDSARIPFGADFVRVVAEEIARADVVIVVIGPQWLDTADDRGRRLDHEDDPVRFEIERALDAKRRIVPVLVGGAGAPVDADLPDVLAPLARLNMATVRNVAFADDFDALVDALLGRPRGAVRTELDHLRRLFVGARAAALVAPAIALLAALGAWAGAFDAFHLDTHVQRALLAQAPPVVAGPVQIAAIDAESERLLGRRWPQPRAAWRSSHAALVDRAAAAGARAVVFDLAFDCRDRDDPCDPEFEPLAAAARRAAARQPPMAVVYGVRDPSAAGPRLAAPLRDSGRVGNVCLFDRGDGAVWSVPLAVLRGDAGAAEVVAADTPALAVSALVPELLRAVDQERRTLGFDGAPREPSLTFSTIERRRESLPSCPLIAAGDLAATLLMRPAAAGHWRGGGRRLPYAALLDPAAVPDAALAGRIVLVGATVDGVRDVFSVQEGFFSARSVYGVELHADALAMLAAGRVPRLVTAGVQAFSSGVAALVGAALAISAWPALLRISAATGIAVIWAGTCFALARRDLLLNPAYDIAALLLTYVLLRLLLRMARRMPQGRLA